MAFKSYSWSIGTTSFRTSQLNYKIERQLQLLKDFWQENLDLNWNYKGSIKNIELLKDEKYPLQIKYYEYMKKNDFITGNAKIRDKDAREKTSGLVNIGMLTKDRKITEVGLQIESLLRIEQTKNNIFYIADDSYNYLLQFLKLQIDEKGIKIRPFIALLYMIEKLYYLSY